MHHSIKHEIFPDDGFDHMGMRGFPQQDDIPHPDFLAALELSPIEVADQCGTHLSEAERIEVASAATFEDAVSSVRLALQRKGFVPEDEYPNIFG